MRHLSDKLTWGVAHRNGGDTSRARGSGVRIMVVKLLILGALAGAIAAAIRWANRRVSGIYEDQERSAYVFANSMINDMAAGPAAEATGASVSALVGAAALPGLSPSSASVEEIASVVSLVSEPGGEIEPGDFVSDIFAKLNAASLLEYSEGPLVCADPTITGAVFRLRGGQLIAVLDASLPDDSTDAANLMRRFEAVVTPGPPGGEPLVIRRFQSLIGEMISL